MTDTYDLTSWTSRTVVDGKGDKIGTLSEIYVDDETGQPEWLAVSTGLFGTKVSFVPIEGARPSGDDIVISYDKAKVKDAPNAEADGHLSPEEEDALYAYYGRTTGTTQTAPRTPAKAPTGDASMVRSEEELSIDKSTREAGRVKLRKWVETDTVQVTVPVEREVARVVREPANGADTKGANAFVEGEEEIVLNEEVVDVNKRVVAKERVGLETETVTENVPVNETVRKERVEVADDENVGKDSGTRRKDSGTRR